MAVFAVTWDAVAFGRLATADTLTGWAADGASPTLETDFFYQGANCISVQVKTAEVGFYFGSGSTDVATTPRVWLAKVIQTNYGAIDGNGLQLRVGSSTSAYHYYFVFSAATYPAIGGWQLVVVDPNVAQWRTGTTGTPNLAAVIYWALRSDASLTAKAPNLGMDAIDIMDRGTGLTGVGGDGISADGTFSDFVSADEGTSTNRWGIVQTRGGILYVSGVLTIGSSGAATEFTDLNRVLVFPHHLVTTGFCGIDFDLQNAGTIITLDSCVFNARGALFTSDDTRPDYAAIGTSGSLTISGSTFNTYRQFDLTTACSLLGCTFLSGGGPINANGAILVGSNVSGYAGVVNSSAVVWNTNNDPVTELEGMIFTKGSVAAHAIEFGITSPLEMTLTDVEFIGYNGTDGQDDSAIHIKRTTGTVTINISGGTVPSYKSDGATVVISATVSYQLTGIVNASEVTIVRTSDTTVLFHEESTSGGVSTYSHGGTIVDIDVLVFHVNYEPVAFLDQLISTNKSVPVQQIEDLVYNNP